MEENCRGCRSEPNCKRYTDIMSKIDIDECVCRECLIKGMCSEPCNDFIKLFEKYYEKQHLIRVWWIKKYNYENRDPT